MAEEWGTVIGEGVGGDRCIASSGRTGEALVGMSIGNCLLKCLRRVDRLSCLEFLVAD